MTAQDKTRVSLGFLVVLAACGIAQTPWPKFRHDLAQTGRSSNGTNAGSGVQRWKFTISAAVRSSAAVGEDGTLYVGSDDGHLYAVKDDGTQKWKFATGGPVSSSPAIRGDGTVFVGSGDGHLYAVKADGTLRWKLPLFGEVAASRNLTVPLPVLSSPAIGDLDVVYVGSQDTNLFAVNANGTLRWKFAATGSVESSPALAADGTIYVGSVDHHLYAVKSDGTLQWKFATGDAIQSSPALAADGTVYVASNDRYLYAVAPDGTLEWKALVALTGAVTSSPAIGADGTIYVGDVVGHLTAVKSDGTIRWTTLVGGMRGSSPAIGADGTIYVGSADQHVYAVKADGAVSWKFPTAGQVTASPAIGADGTLYVGAASGGLYALTSVLPPSGTRLRLTSAVAAGTCGALRAGGPGGSIVKSLRCGGINVGGGQSTFVEALVPNGAVTEFNTACSGAACAVTARSAAETGSNDTCSAAGCRFGPYVPVSNAGTSICLSHAFTAAAGGTLESALGTFTGTFPLSSTIYLTGNASSPCPRCVGGGPGSVNSGVCDPAWSSGSGAYADAGTPCTPLNGAGDTYDCEPATAAVFPAIPLSLSPVTTGPVSLTGSGGAFCPLQVTPGAFGCRTAGGASGICPSGVAGANHIEETGVPAGALTPGPHPMTLASTFCIPAVGGPLSFIVNGAVDLPGPGALSLPVNAELIP
jgi:outer membrane protein assembly factor BamB